jgi:hypothetical protein
MRQLNSLIRGTTGKGLLLSQQQSSPEIAPREKAIVSQDLGLLALLVRKACQSLQACKKDTHAL